LQDDGIDYDDCCCRRRRTKKKIMTIHADWIHQFKSWAPDAFTSEIPQPPVAGFIDGQIKLMGMPRPQTGVPTWDLFLRSQFIAPIQHMWRYHVPPRHTH
jgi:hypothetical protein